VFITLISFVISYLTHLFSSYFLFFLHLAEYVNLVESFEYKLFTMIFNTYSMKFLEGVGRSDLAQTYKPESLFCWASISHSSNFHLPHTHPHSSISGVYYTRIPSGAGKIIFDDPRGPRWPFEGRLIHEPSPGDLLLFPSWLVHQVTTTTSTHSDPRISISCNTKGAWDDLADINLR
jgi:hypothetical protein